MAMEDSPGAVTPDPSPEQAKPAVRVMLRERIAALGDTVRQVKSALACNQIAGSPEFSSANVVMLFLSSHDEIDTAAIALKCWQSGKTVVVPKVNWNQRRMLPVELSSLHSVVTSDRGIREPVDGKPCPIDLIDLVIVPGLGFSTTGHRIGRGMGFYDRFLAQEPFAGLTCGLAYEEQVVPALPLLEHDVPLDMLVTDTQVRRFTKDCVSN